MTVAEHLSRRARLLASALEAEIMDALALLGQLAVEAWGRQPIAKASRPPQPAYQAVEAILRQMDIPGWIDSRLLPLLRFYAVRTAQDAARVMREETGLDFTPSQVFIEELQAGVGAYLHAPELESQVREAFARLINDMLLRGYNPITIGRAIRQAVQAGRFVHAGPKYRANLIARNEVANWQRESEMAMIEANPNVSGIRLRDGIYGPPRSDSACIERDGEEVSVTQMRRVHPYHPLCTLGFDPIIE